MGVLIGPIQFYKGLELPKNVSTIESCFTLIFHTKLKNYKVFGLNPKYIYNLDIKNMDL